MMSYLTNDSTLRLMLKADRDEGAPLPPLEKPVEKVGRPVVKQ
jgi:hypothetical protein